MGLKIHTLAEIPDSVSKKYYLYILDYYNWDEPIGNTLRENFEKIAEFAANNNSVVIQGIAGSHFYSELMSWRSINGIDPLELLTYSSFCRMESSLTTDIHWCSQLFKRFRDISIFEIVQ